MVPVREAAVEAWRDLADPPPLTLHLCLTEGHRLPNCPDLPTGFGGLLLASLLPWQRQRIAPQLRTVLLQQISRYRQLTGLQHIRLDGHQHIHLVPLVLDAVLDLARSESITWVRTTREPLPEGLSLRLWWRSLQTGGLLKWLVLQLLSGLAMPRLRRAGLQTNRRFAGVLFSGSMFGTAFRRCWETAYSSSSPRPFFTGGCASQVFLMLVDQEADLFHPALHRPNAASPQFRDWINTQFSCFSSELCVPFSQPSGNRPSADPSRTGRHIRATSTFDQPSLLDYALQEAGFSIIRTRDWEPVPQASINDASSAASADAKNVQQLQFHQLEAFLMHGS